MSTMRLPPPAKLVCSLFSRDVELIHRAAGALVRIFGPLDWQSLMMPFDCTSYYEHEFGTGLQRQFVGFARAVNQGSLVDIKHAASKLEHEFGTGGRRKVNIDPGILTAERLVLTTGKNFTHRVYLGRGVFADLTLIYQRNSFRPLPWTYPDYASPQMIAFWNTVRRSFLWERKMNDGPAYSGEGLGSGPGSSSEHISCAV
jgi:hypothetical protein